MYEESLYVNDDIEHTRRNANKFIVIIFFLKILNIHISYEYQVYMKEREMDRKKNNNLHLY